MENIDYKRQSDIFDPAGFFTSVTIVGLGNIGTHTALTLARLGIKYFHLCDGDSVENHNLTSQGYSIHDLGKLKPDALADRMMSLNPSISISTQGDYTGINVGDSEILIIAIDTMEGRKTIHANLKREKTNFKLIIDARIGGPQLEIYTSHTLDEWGATFFDNPAQDACGGRFICYTPIITGALIANQVRKFLMDQSYHKSIVMHVDSLEVLKS